MKKKNDKNLAQKRLNFGIINFLKIKRKKKYALQKLLKKNYLQH